MSLNPALGETPVVVAREGRFATNPFGRLRMTRSASLGCHGPDRTMRRIDATTKSRSTRSLDRPDKVFVRFDRSRKRSGRGEQRVLRS